METRLAQSSLLEALSEGPFTIEELAEKTKMHRTTVSKYLAVMEAAKIVEYRSIGKAKMFFVTKSLFQKRSFETPKANFAAEAKR